MKKMKYNTVVCSVMKNVRIMEGKKTGQREGLRTMNYTIYLQKNTVLNTNEPNN